MLRCDVKFCVSEAWLLLWTQSKGLREETIMDGNIKYDVQGQKQ